MFKMKIILIKGVILQREPGQKLRGRSVIQRKQICREKDAPDDATTGSQLKRSMR